MEKTSKKSSAPNLKVNYIYRLLYDILTVIIPFITTPYVSRVLGTENMGIYSYTHSVITYFTLFAALGTVSYGAREIAQKRDDPAAASKLFWEIELMTVLTSLACIVIWIGVILFSHENKYYYLAHLPLLIATMLDISWYFTGYEKIKYIVIRNSVCKLLSLVLLFVLVKSEKDLMIYILINSVVMAVGNLSMWTYLPGMLKKVDFRTLTFKHHFKETLVYFVPTIATSIYTVLDKTLIGAITHDNYANGYYEYATKVLHILKSLVFTSVNAIMGARISYLYAQERYAEIKQRIEKSMSFIFLMGFGAACGTIGIAENFVPIFFGKGNEPVVQLLWLMAPLVLIIGVSNCLGSQYYTPSGQRSKSAKIIVIGSLVNLVLNLIMIPFFGATGATVASIIAELVISMSYVALSKGYMSAAILLKNGWKKLIAGVVMCAAVILTGSVLSTGAIVTLVIQIFCGVAVYGILLLVMKDSTILWLLDSVFGSVRKKLSHK